MNVEAQLDPFGDDVVLDEVTLRTPGLSGRARVMHPAAAEMRAEAQWTGELERALANEHVQPQVVVEISETEETETGGAGTRSTSYGEDAMELQVPGPSRGWGQMVLYTDESGVTTWEFIEDQGSGAELTRGSATATYLIRRRVAPPEPADGRRGLLSAVGKKLISVVAFKLIDPIIGEIGEFFAERWEQKKRPYRLRTFTPDDYDHPQGSGIDRGSWERLAGGRALLLVHGTFSRAHTGFGGMPRSFVEDLHRIYEGRVFAFDHFTLSHTPKRNIEWLLEQLPRDLDSEVDIICHSRGGLVSRTLAEKQGELSSGARKVKVGRVVFVATPNAGTALTDAKHMGAFIDTYTNLMNFVPDNGVTEVLEGIVTVAKLLATGVLKGLAGLQSMNPQGKFLTWLNAPADGQASYFALAGDYEPVNAGWKQWAKDCLMDAIFKQNNDLVVPTDGVFTGNGSSHFPIEECVKYSRNDGISHSTFFPEKRTQQKILSWLEAAP